MDSRKLLFIVNPRSGRAAIKYHLLEALETFAAAGWLVTIYITRRAGDASETAAQIGGDYDLIVVSGGDGTVNETINGLMRLPRRVPFGILPAGTTNDYAYSLGIPVAVADAARNVVEGMPFDIDLGLLNDRYFAYVAAFGQITEVTYETPQDMKNILGYAAYALEGAKRILDIKTHHIKIEYDGGALEDDVMIGLISNTKSVAGLRTAFDDARLDDGLLEVTLVRAPKNLADVQSIINILLDFEHINTVENDFITHLSTSRLSLSSDGAMKWTVDGENGGSHTSVNISAAHLAATVISGPRR